MNGTQPAIVNDRCRYFCPRCDCEVGAPGEHPNRPIGDVLNAEGLLHGTHGVAVKDEHRVGCGSDEPLHFDEHCDCDCHAAWRMTWAVR